MVRGVGRVRVGGGVGEGGGGGGGGGGEDLRASDAAKWKRP